MSFRFTINFTEFENSIIEHFLLVHLDGTENRSSELPSDRSHACHHSERQYEIIWEHHSNSILILIEDRFGQPHCMAEPQRVRLLHPDRFNQLTSRSDPIKLVNFSSQLQRGF